MRLDAGQHKQRKVADQQQHAEGGQRLEQADVALRLGDAGEAVVIAVDVVVIAIAAVVGGGGEVARAAGAALRVDGVAGERVGEGEAAGNGDEEGEDPEEEVDADVGAGVDGAVDGAADGEGEVFGYLPEEGYEGLGIGKRGEGAFISYSILYLVGSEKRKT